MHPIIPLMPSDSIRNNTGHWWLPGRLSVVLGMFMHRISVPTPTPEVLLGGQIKGLLFQTIGLGWGEDMIVVD